MPAEEITLDVTHLQFAESEDSGDLRTVSSTSYLMIMALKLYTLLLKLGFSGFMRSHTSDKTYAGLITIFY